MAKQSSIKLVGHAKSKRDSLAARLAELRREPVVSGALTEPEELAVQCATSFFRLVGREAAYKSLSQSDQRQLRALLARAAAERSAVKA